MKDRFVSKTRPHGRRCRLNQQVVKTFDDYGHPSCRHRFTLTVNRANRVLAHCG